MTIHWTKRQFALSLASAALVLGGTVTAHAQTALDDVLKAKEIKIAIPTDYPPYGFVGTDLKPQGLDVDMANYIAAKLGVKVELLPVTSANRIAMIAKEAEGFLYLVSSLGVTGTRSEIKTDLGSIVDVVRENTDVPCAIGFGISTPEQAKKMADLSDGAIVGSAIVKILAQYGKDAPKYVGEYVKRMKDALR